MGLNPTEFYRVLGRVSDLKWNSPKGLSVRKTLTPLKGLYHIGPEVTALTMAFDYLPLIRGIRGSSMNSTSARNSHGSLAVIAVLNSYVFPEQNSARERGLFALYPLHGHLYTHNNTPALILVA